MKPLVTIAVPTLNRLRYLKEAVASGLAQTYPNVEVLISDDGSSDGTADWCRSLASADRKVRYQRNKTRRGLAGNWNALADSARGRYMMLMGDDDRLLPDCVEKLMEAGHDEAHVVFSNHYLIDGEGRRLDEESIQQTRVYRRDILSPGRVPSAGTVVWQNSVPIPSLLRTEEVRRLRFKEDLNCPEIELFARLAHEGGSFVFVPDYLTEYRTHLLSATGQGLYMERLTEHLLRIHVTPEVERYKREFMAYIIVNAVNRCLRQGQRDAARRFLKSDYYPKPFAKKQGDSSMIVGGQDRTSGPGFKSWGRKRILKVTAHTLLQRACTALPAQVGCPLYRLVYKIKAAAS